MATERIGAVDPIKMALSLIETYGTRGQLHVSGISSDELLFRGLEADDPTRLSLQPLRSILPDRVGVKIYLNEGLPIIQVRRGRGRRHLEYGQDHQSEPVIGQILVNLDAII